MFDLESLTRPISADDPCGPDLDLEGDTNYLNFFASAEQILPTSYFDVLTPTGDRGRFDPKSIDFDAYFSAAAPLLARTRDLRLTVLLAKLSILSRDLAGFSNCLNAIASLLDLQWDAVHPRAEDDDYIFRAVTIEALDVMPTVVNPLQFLPLIESRRHGTVTYRAYQAAKGQIAGGDSDFDLTAIEQIIAETNLEKLKSTYTAFTDLGALLLRIQMIWHDKSGSAAPLSFEKLSAVVTGIAAWFEDIVRSRDPSAIASPGDADGPRDDEDAVDSTPRGDAPKLTSAGIAAAALDAIARYFAANEPSSPLLLLVRQAQEMVGKSFIDAIRLLVPDHVGSAAVNIGRGEFFDLPIERMASLLDDGTLPGPGQAADPDVSFMIQTRGQALALLADVAVYFRATEPSSPIPLLADRARELAQRDFLTLLQEVLPQGTLKTIDR